MKSLAKINAHKDAYHKHREKAQNSKTDAGFEKHWALGDKHRAAYKKLLETHIKKHGPVARSTNGKYTHGKKHGSQRIVDEGFGSAMWNGVHKA